MTFKEAVIAKAHEELGYLEKATNSQLDDKTANAGHGDWTKYARDLDKTALYNGGKNGYAWCQMFQDWLPLSLGLKDSDLMAFCGKPLGGYGAGCTYSMRYFQEMGNFSHIPAVGDQVFYTRDGGNTSYHVGLVISVLGTSFKTIEGNTSNAQEVEPNGGTVAIKSYSSYRQSYIAGFGRPNYQAFDYVVTPPVVIPTVSAYAVPSWEWALKHGLITDSDPQGLVNREQLCFILKKLCEAS